MSWLAKLLRPFFETPPDVYVCTGVEYVGVSPAWRTHRYIAHYTGPFGSGTRELHFSTFIPLDQVHDRAVKVIAAMGQHHGHSL